MNSHPNDLSVISQGRISALCFPLLIATLIVVPAAAVAQLLEEIIVTAQKREQSAQDVSIAINAWSGEQMDQLGLEASSDIARITPGVHIAATSAGQDAQFTIRGVTQTDFNDYIEPPNAVYVDDGYMATAQSHRFGMFDLERVEVLKGPQGTLFGRNATGGLIHYVSRKPTAESEGYAELLYGTENQIRFQGALSGPLSDNVSGRLAAVYNQHDEITDNVYPLLNVDNPLTGQPFVGSPSGASDFWNDDSWALRGHLLWEFNDNSELLLTAFASGEEISTGQYEAGATTAIIDANGNHVNTIFAINDPLACEAISAETGACLPIDFVDGTFGQLTRPVQGGDLFGFIDPGGGGDQVVSVDHALDDFNTYDVFGLTAKLTWGFDAFTLTSVSHFVDYEKEQTLDVDVGPAPQSIVMNNNESDTFSQEIRLNGEGDRHRWVAGAYYLSIDNSNVIGLGFSPDSPITLLLPFGPFETDSFVDWDRRSWSLFGQIDYDLSDRLTLVAGARVINEENDFDYVQLFYANTNDATVDDNQAPLTTGFEYPPFSDKVDDTLWAGRLVLEYRPNDDTMMYGGINRGVKAGGFNGKLNDFTPPLPVANIPYEDEVLTSFEIGFKSDLAGGRARLNGSAYYYDYKDYQGFVFVQSSGFVRNADAEYAGVELELLARPTDNLDLLFNVAYIDAEVQGLEIATGVVRNVEPAHTPELQFMGLGRYTWPNSLFGGGVAFQVDFSYTDSRFHNIRNFDAQNMDAYTLVNARLSWLSDDERWVVTAFGSNIFDETYKTTGFDLSTLCGCNEEAYGRPAWWGATVRYSWR